MQFKKEPQQYFYNLHAKNHKKMNSRALIVKQELGIRSTITVVKNMQKCQSKMTRLTVSKRLAFLYVNEPE